MSNEFKETFGSWLQAIGTVLSAIANTPSLVSDYDSANNLDIVGNTLQGTGNALIADGEEAFTLDQIGSAVQAVGNSTVITGLIGTFSDDTNDLLIIDGNFIQALGGGVSAADITENSPAEGLNIVGNLLQLIGNSLQALSGIIELKREDTDPSLESQGNGSQGNGNSGNGNKGNGNQGYGKQGNGNKGNGNQGYGSQGYGGSGYGMQGYGNLGYGSQGYGSQGNGNQDDDGGGLDPQTIQTLGSWIQAIGAVLTLIAQLISNEEGESGDEGGNESES
ncbi:DUF6944 family repetitive protein [Peribacillus sp. NPDC097295]|uniref:DUF6944 family repetitive protein n=1 Tax=Peribacillus sp. NPDC097295 TaxID=3364402 RepID=UPI0038124661